MSTKRLLLLLCSYLSSRKPRFGLTIYLAFQVYILLLKTLICCSLGHQNRKYLVDVLTGRDLSESRGEPLHHHVI